MDLQSMLLGDIWDQCRMLLEYGYRSVWYLWMVQLFRGEIQL